MQYNPHLTANSQPSNKKIPQFMPTPKFCYCIVIDPYR